MESSEKITKMWIICELIDAWLSSNRKTVALSILKTEASKDLLFVDCFRQIDEHQTSEEI